MGKYDKQNLILGMVLVLLSVLTYVVLSRAVVEEIELKTESKKSLVIPEDPLSFSSVMTKTKIKRRMR